MKFLRICLNIENFYFLRKISIFTTKKNNNVNNFRFSDEKLNDNLEKKRNRNQKNFIVDDLKNFLSKKTFTFLDNYLKKKMYINKNLKYYLIMLIKIQNLKNRQKHNTTKLIKINIVKKTK